MDFEKAISKETFLQFVAALRADSAASRAKEIKERRHPNNCQTELAEGIASNHDEALNL